jgi:probable HAF family extracellular repeat protein
MIRTATLIAILSSLHIVADFEPAIAYTHHFTSIRYPRTLETWVYAINNNGGMVGTYDGQDGFVYGEEAFASLDSGRVFILPPTAINDLGQIAGHSVVRKGWSWERHAFLHDEGKIVNPDFPFSNRRSRSRQPMIFPLGINNEGTVVGMQVKPGNLKTRPFIYEDWGFRSIGPFRKGLNYIGGINDEGLPAGHSSKLGAYLYDGATFTPISYSFPLFPMDLNISDQVVGFYFGGDRRAHGFFYDDGRVLTIDYPGAAGTFLTSINDRGDLAGWYREEGTNHSFVATPVPIPGSVWLLGTGLVGLALASQSLLPCFRPRRSFMQK